MKNYAGAVFSLIAMLLIALVACALTGLRLKRAKADFADAQAALDASLAQRTDAESSLAALKKKNAHVLAFQAAWASAFGPVESAAIVSRVNSLGVNAGVTMTNQGTKIVPYNQRGTMMEVTSVEFSMTGDVAKLFAAGAEFPVQFPSSRLERLALVENPTREGTLRCDVQFSLPMFAAKAKSAK